MTMTPEPTDKLDATTNVAVNGPADEMLPNEPSYDVMPPEPPGLA